MVIWSQPAKVDLRAIHDYIACNSPYYAKKVTQDIREKTDILEKLPKAGRKVPELNDEHVRELSLYSYRIMYEIKNQGIFVLAVVHKRWDLKIEDIERKPMQPVNGEKEDSAGNQGMDGVRHDLAKEH